MDSGETLDDIWESNLGEGRLDHTRAAYGSAECLACLCFLLFLFSFLFFRTSGSYERDYAGPVWCVNRQILSLRG